MIAEVLLATKDILSILQKIQKFTRQIMCNTFPSTM